MGKADTAAPPPWASGLHLLGELWAAEPPPVLEADVRHLIMATTPQGRVEILPDPLGLGTVPGLVKLDGRFFYSICCRELGVGPVERDTVPEYAGFRRGRYRVRFTVPPGWEHIGLLPVKAEDHSSWVYPCTPGECHETWADGAELHVALFHRWPVTILERILFTGGGRPLDAWRDRLLKALNRRGTDDAAGRVKDVLRQSIGALAERPPVRRLTVADDGPPIDPVHLGGPLVRQWREGHSWILEVERPRPKGTLRGAHPEIAAQVWARARARIATAALQLPREQLVAMRTDALYVTEHPGWEDDGRNGTFREEWTRPGPLPWPREWAELAEPSEQ